jgi:hypothetical protein
MPERINPIPPRRKIVVQPEEQPFEDNNRGVFNINAGNVIGGANQAFRVQFEGAPNAIPQARKQKYDVYYGAEVEYFCKVGETIVRARGVTPGTDSNDSVAELRTPPVKSPAEVYKAIGDEIKSAAKYVADKAPFHTLRTSFLFTPMLYVPTNYNFRIDRKLVTLPLQLVKTAGVHFHSSGIERSDEDRARIISQYLELHEKMSQICHLRFEWPVVGPVSGQIYRYGGVERFWQNKDKDTGARHHWEFRPIPSSLLAVSLEGVEAAYRLMDGQATKSDQDLLVDLCSTPIGIRLAELLEVRDSTIHHVRLSKKPPYFQESSRWTIPGTLLPDMMFISGNLDEEEPQERQLIRTIVRHAFDDAKFMDRGAWYPKIIFLEGAVNPERFLNDLLAGKDITPYLSRQSAKSASRLIKEATHSCPPIIDRAERLAEWITTPEYKGLYNPVAEAWKQQNAGRVLNKPRPDVEGNIWGEDENDDPFDDDHDDEDND